MPSLCTNRQFTEVFNLDLFIQLEGAQTYYKVMCVGSGKRTGPLAILVDDVLMMSYLHTSVLGRSRDGQD